MTAQTLSSLMSNNLLKVAVRDAVPMILKSKSEKCENIAFNYCDNSSIHGMKYISNNKSRTLLQKVLWFMCIFISFSLFGYLSARINQKREESPVIVSFNEVPVPIWQIPFPAISICLETKARYDLFQFTHTYLKLMKNDSLEKFTKQE